MARTLNALVIVLFSCILLFACREVSKEDDTSTKNAIPTTTRKGEPREFLPDLPRIGSTFELGKDDTCGKSDDNILAYAETYKYHIYICGEETTNKPKSMIIFTAVGNSNKTVIHGNPSISWNKSYIFSYGEFGAVLNRPFISTSYIPQFYIFVRFANEQFIKEKILVYLFNEKTVPNYKKTILPPDNQVKEHFLKYSPNFRCQYQNKIGVIPKQVVAYEIAPKKFLIEVTCFLPEYNGEYQYILYSEESSVQKAKIVPFQTLISPESGKIQVGEVLMISGLLQFFPEDNTLRVFSKGIGAGGCGYAAEYRLIGERFELQEFRKYDDCRNFLSPEEFPKIYP